MHLKGANAGVKNDLDSLDQLNLSAHERNQLHQFDKVVVGDQNLQGRFGKWPVLSGIGRHVDFIEGCFGIRKGRQLKGQ